MNCTRTGTHNESIKSPLDSHRYNGATDLVHLGKVDLLAHAFSSPTSRRKDLPSSYNTFRYVHPCSYPFGLTAYQDVPALV